MARNPTYDTPTRHPEDTGLAIVSREFSFGAGGLATGLPIGAVEKNAIPLRAGISILTAFNAGTTNTLEVGTAANASGLITGANSAANTAGNNKQGTGTLLGAPVAADTIFVAKFTQAGTAATAGRAVAWVEFIVPRTEDPRTRAGN